MKATEMKSLSEFKKNKISLDEVNGYKIEKQNLEKTLLGKVIVVKQMT